jgi:hypothetical protein
MVLLNKMPLIILHKCIRCKKVFLCDTVMDKCYCPQEIIYLRNHLYRIYFCSGLCIKKYIEDIELLD